MAEDETADPDRLTYAEAGVDTDASEAAAAVLVAAVDDFQGDFAGVLDIGDRYLALATDGVGTKLLVAEALGDYSTVGIDCIAMNANDLVAAGVRPVAFVDYLAVEEPDDDVAGAIGTGLARGAELADLELLGGETAVMPEVITGLDLAGACVGLGTSDELLDGTAEPGDVLVGFPSSGIHSNGLTLARAAVTRRHAYTDPFPADTSRTIGEELLIPTRIYTHLLGPLRAHSRGVAHITGGGLTNLQRLGDHRYLVDDPLPSQAVFGFIQDEGDVTDEEMHRTFNMGTGMVAAVDASAAEALVATTEDGAVIGRVEDGSGVEIRGMTL